MTRVRILGACLAAMFAVSAIGAASAYAEPEFIPKTGQFFPKNFTSSGGKTLFATPKADIECTISLDRGTILALPAANKSMLGDILFTYHECIIKSGPGAGTKCTSQGQKEGLIQTPSYVFHLGALVVLTNGKKDVLILVLVTPTTFTCDAGLINVTVSGNLIGVAPEETKTGAKQFNKIISSLEVEFKQVAAGKQQFNEFEFTLPTEKRTGLHLVAEITLLGNEEVSQESTNVETLEGGETVTLLG